MNISPPAGPSTITRKRRPLAWTMCWLAVICLFIYRFQEFGGSVKSPVEHFEQAVALALEDLQSRVGHHLHPLLQEVDSGERISVTAQEEGRAADRGQM